MLAGALPILRSDNGIAQISKDVEQPDIGGLIARLSDQRGSSNLPALHFRVDEEISHIIGPALGERPGDDDFAVSVLRIHTKDTFL